MMHFARSISTALCAVSLVLIACSDDSSATSNACASLAGTYQGSYAVTGGDCPAGTEYEPSSVSVQVTMTNGRFYLSAAGQSCNGTLDSACQTSTLAGVCDGTVGIGTKSYANLSRVAFGAGGSLAVTGINKTPTTTEQCVMQVSFTGQKTAD
jgi:hypothetical protein